MTTPYNNLINNVTHEIHLTFEKSMTLILSFCKHIPTPSWWRRGRGFLGPTVVISGATRAVREC